MSAQTIIVTGAGRGIGLSIVEQLLSQAAHGTVIIAVDLLGEELEAITSSAPEKIEVVVGDISERSTSARAVERAKARTGRLDTLVLNAGILRPVGPIAKVSVEDWKRLFEVNFFALLHTPCLPSADFVRGQIQLALPELRRNNGKIIMTSSGVTSRPFQSWVPYACAKSAMNYLCGSLPLEEPLITCVCISPGIVNTAMQQEVRDEHKEDIPTDLYEWTKGLYEKGELLRPDQPAASFVNLVLNGIPSTVVGQMVEWDDPRISKY